ncbi:MAG TPA: GNAT family N-acetyltransferase [Actinomycetota bacterium]|nr:GNAT family N-acetyltransferase [Actinomycetota bacterium]
MGGCKLTDENEPRPHRTIRLRDVEDADVEVFYEHQLDEEATGMAAFPARDREAHFAHWAKIRNDETCVTKTIVADGEVAGNIGSWLQDAEREVGYWIGKPYWGRGIATGALRALLEVVEERPLYGWVAQHNTGSIRVLEKVGFVFDRREGDHFVYKVEVQV